jgi:hypothetical protein
VALHLYTTGDNKLNLYNTNVFDHVDMRQELNDILYKEKQGSDIIYRRAIIENGQPKKCPCALNSRSGEPDRDIACELCSGLGYYFKDISTKCYINNSQAYSIYKKTKQPGDSQVEYKTVYFEWDFLSRLNDNSLGIIPSRFDRIIKLNQDLAGITQSPTKAREIYEILSVDPYQLDKGGRIEYYRLRVISVIDKSYLV